MAKRSDSQKALQNQILKKLMSENQLLKSQAQKKDALIVKLLEQKYVITDGGLKSDRKNNQNVYSIRKDDRDHRLHTRIKTLIDLLPDGF